MCDRARNRLGQVVLVTRQVGARRNATRPCSMTSKISGVSPHMFIETTASSGMIRCSGAPPRNDAIAPAWIPRTSSRPVSAPSASSWHTARLTGPEGERVSRNTESGQVPRRSGLDLAPPRVQQRLVGVRAVEVVAIHHDERAVHRCPDRPDRVRRAPGSRPTRRQARCRPAGPRGAAPRQQLHRPAVAPLQGRKEIQGVGPHDERRRGRSRRGRHRKWRSP